MGTRCNPHLCAEAKRKGFNEIMINVGCNPHLCAEAKPVTIDGLYR